MSTRHFAVALIFVIAGATALYTAGAEDVTGSRQATSFWRPPLDMPWQWQLNTPVDPSVDAAFFDIDLFENEPTVIAALHSRGKKVACYINVGSWEDWRPDADRFPPSVIGKSYTGWAGEKWLDIRQISLLAPLIRERLNLCKAKGFDAVEPDNVDGYTNRTGFPLTASDQLKYNRWLAAEAHARGLLIGLKNDGDQVRELLVDFDWALTEDCFDQGWCEQVTPFIEVGKPVFAAEYTDTGMTLDELCPKARTLHFNAILKHRNLHAWRETCQK